MQNLGQGSFPIKIIAVRELLAKARKDKLRKHKTEAQMEYDRVKSRERWAANKHIPEFREKSKQNTRRWQLTHPEKYMWGRSRQNAKKLNVPFDIELSDIKIPEVCPILGVPLVVGTRYTPSVDRIRPELGYIKGNIQIVSLRANAMKSDATKQDLTRFAQWILNQE